MLLCYFISKKDYSMLNCVPVVSHSISHTIDCSGKTKIQIYGNPKACDEDFVILKDGKETKFKGVIENIENADGEKEYAVSCLEIERCFDREILISDTTIINNAGIEDFIAKTIQTYFSQSGDSFIDMSYIKCIVLTHTKINSKPSGDDGIYNFKTYIGNIKQQYGIFLDFEFEKDELIVYIHKKEQAAMQIDTTTTDIDSCKEIYKVKALSKLNVKYLNSVTQAATMRYFYLHSDRSVSEVDKDRIDGTISTVFIEAETEAEMIQAAKDKFKSNSYSHSIEANIIATSKIYPIDELYVGHEVTIKTSAAGIQKSIISEISFTDAADLITVKFGILKVKLTDKLK